MDERLIAAIALSNRDFSSLDEKLAEAVGWIELAALSGAKLAILPELLNRFCGDGAGNPRALSDEEIVFEDWTVSCRVLIEAAAKYRIAVVIPVLRQAPENSGGRYVNVFYFVSPSGEVIGEYQKRFPTPDELKKGVLPGETPLIDWDGVKVGGAICFDTLFPEVFADQVRDGADFFVVPSMWPGGSQLNHYALEHSTPIALAYPAWSRIIDIDGSEVAGAGYRNETLRFGFGSPIAMAPINFDQVALYGNINQQRMVDVQRAYGARVRIRFVQQDVLFVLESRCPDLRIDEVVREFELIPRREYFARCRDQVTEFTK